MTTMKTDSQNVTWTDIERMTKLLSKKISVLSKDFSSISTISRGGLVLARLLEFPSKMRFQLPSRFHPN
ncbi:MAG: hypothetical protein WD717_08165 [Nitrosarchaeum sp.]